MPIIEEPDMKLNLLTDPAVRGWIYRTATAVIALLVVYGIVGETEAAQWALLAAAILGAGEGTLASVNTSTKREEPTDA